jgi:dTDP-4-dehydrorhamnose 3,5-epimerase
MKSRIDGVVIRVLKRRVDARGWLMELYRHDELPDGVAPVMAYVSSTASGVGRGPHEHREQTDVLCFVNGAWRLHLWDNRTGSPTYGLHETFEIADGEAVQVVIPPGVVHGYRNVGETDGLIFNAADRLYASEGRRGEVDEIRHEDDPGSAFRMPE